MNDDWFFIILKSLMDVNKIANYNYCAYLLRFLNDIVVEWTQNHMRYFRGPLLFLMVSEVTPTFISLYKMLTFFIELVAYLNNIVH